MKTLRFGSRTSDLALAQTRLVMDAVGRAHPEYRLELVPIATRGDVDMKPFSEASDTFGIKGLFTRELEEALLDGSIDVAVHSLKDLPAVQDERLPLLACFRRGDPRDVLALPAGAEAMNGALIGCSSARRRLQALDLFEGAEVRPVRGNVGTRLRKLDEGQFSALILAAAGLERLGLRARVSRYFSLDEIVPAPGQGILACQGRAGDKNEDWLDAIFDPDATECARAERACSAALGGGCAAPVGACARLHGGEMKLTGFFADESRGLKLRASLTGRREEARRLGEMLAEKILREAR